MKKCSECLLSFIDGVHILKCSGKGCFFYCIDERKHGIFCGPEGKLFEPKDKE